jgi:hypothetical protein
VTTSVSGDLDWWRERRNTPDADEPAMRALLARLNAWKERHDHDRAGQPGPFLKMVWDAIFGDEHEEVAEAIRALEAALGEGGDLASDR